MSFNLFNLNKYVTISRFQIAVCLTLNINFSQFYHAPFKTILAFWNINRVWDWAKVLSAMFNLTFHNLEHYFLYANMVKITIEFA